LCPNQLAHLPQVVEEAARGVAMSDANWTLTLRPLLDALKPERVGVSAPQSALVNELADHAQVAGYMLVDSQDAAADVVIVDARREVDFSIARPLVIVLGDDADLLADADGWASRRIGGFGAMTLLASAGALHAQPSYAQAWESVGGVHHLEALCRELEFERVRLETVLVAERLSWAELEHEFESALDQLEHNEGEFEHLLTEAATAAVQLRALRRRKRLLDKRLARATALAATARTQRDTERAWVAQQVSRVAASQSWRVGHSIVRTTRRLTLRRDRGTDALIRILERLGTADRTS
jgi:hypothetical protein